MKTIGSVVGAVSGLGSIFGAGEQQKGYQQAQGMAAGDKARYEPFVQGGLEGFNEFQQAVLGDSISGFENFMQRPDIQYQIGQGMDTATQGLAGRGMLNSGLGLRELQGVGQDIAGQGFQQYLGNLGALSNYGTNALDAQTGIGRDQMSARIGAGSARGSQYQLIGDLAGSERFGDLFDKEKRGW